MTKEKPPILAYAYFRFYADEDIIHAGLNNYCTDYTMIQQPGYNYKEYKCYVDNIGGLDNWIGSVEGYLSAERERGFIDGSPSDAINDTSLIMGKTKLTDDDFLTLNAIPRNKVIYFRKITAQDSGIAHKVKLTCGDAIINHPVMYTLDTTQIEILKPEDIIVDNSDVGSYEFVVDINATWLMGGIQDSLTCGSVANFANMVDRDKTTYARVTTGNNALCDLIVDMEEPFSSIAIRIRNYEAFPIRGWCFIYTSPDKVTWTQIGTAGYTNFNGTISNNNVAGRYIKFRFDSTASDTSCKVDIYRILCSI